MPVAEPQVADGEHFRQWQCRGSTNQPVLSFCYWTRRDHEGRGVWIHCR